VSSYKGINIQGEVMLDPLDEFGNRTGYLDPLNTLKFTLKVPEPDKEQRVSNTRGSEGQVLATRYTPKPTTLEIEMDDQPVEILAAAFMGNYADYAQSASTATDTAITLIPGRWVALGKKSINVSGFSVATAAVPATPLVEDTDYEVNRTDGLIRAKAGGAISEPTPCLVDMGWGALAGFEIVGSVRNVVPAALLIKGINVDGGKRCELEIYRAELYANGDLDFMGRKFISTKLQGMMLTPTGDTSPYRYREFA
jgi:hypothetical protein